MRVIPNDANGDVIKWLSLYLRGQSDWGTVQERSAQNLLCVIKNRSHITASHSYSKNKIHPQYTSYCRQTTANLQCSSKRCSRTVETHTKRERERERKGGWVRERVSGWVSEWMCNAQCRQTPVCCQMSFSTHQMGHTTAEGEIPV